MRLKIVLVAALCMFTQGAHADTLDQIAGKSAFVTTTLKFLKSKRAVSVYASTKPYCPSAFWWSARPAADRDARRGFQKQITLQIGDLATQTRSRYLVPEPLIRLCPMKMASVLSILVLDFLNASLARLLMVNGSMVSQMM